MSYTIHEAFVSSNDYSSNLADVKCEGFILSPFFYLIYINDLNIAVKYSEVHCFADETLYTLTIV